MSRLAIPWPVAIGPVPSDRWTAIRTVVPRAVLVLVVLLVVSATLPAAISHADGRDVDAYWGAAMRLRAGEPLYAPGAPTDSDVYRYAPWFAYAWIPLTHLPREPVVAAWVALMFAAALLSTAPLLSRGVTGLAAFALITPFQLDGAAYGNVQPLLVLVLVWGVERGSGPLWVALGASLKAAPGVLALVYLARGEYRRGLAAIGLTLVLVAPMLLHDLGGYTTAPGRAQMSLWTVSPLLFAAGALAAAVAVFALRSSHFAWLAGGAAVLAWLPRLLTYEIGFLLVGVAATWSHDLRRLGALRVSGGRRGGRLGYPRRDAESPGGDPSPTRPRGRDRFGGVSPPPAPPSVLGEAPAARPPAARDRRQRRCAGELHRSPPAPRP